ncbi:MAG: hypothetical protein KAX65_15695, partial [Caldilineaceae bacterium]|nr:hypothetical protein [Caldilineaceae bacterium]
MASSPPIQRFLTYLAAILAGGLLLSLIAWPRLVAAQGPDPVAAAWAAARAAGSYHFDSDVTQITIPSPTVTNIGRSSQTQTLHLSGQTDLRAQALEMQLWSKGGSLLQAESSLAVKVEQGASYV